MGSIAPRFSVGGTGLPISFTAVEAIVGGNVVEARAAGGNPGSRWCGVAGAGSELVVGVALFDVPATAAHIAGPKVGDEHALTVVRACVIPVVFSGAAVAGDKLIAAAAGKVGVAGAAPDAATVIGQALEIAADGQTKLAYIF
jgi:hypothetical protein